MKVDFERLHWENYPSTETPLNAENLNRLEEGLAGLYSDVAEIEEGIAGVYSDVAEMQESISGFRSDISGMEESIVSFRANITGFRSDMNEMAEDIAELTGKIVIVKHENETVNNGYCPISYPDGFSSSDVLIIQPLYYSGQPLGWTATLQKGTDSINVYVRQGTTTPANGSKINFDAIFIKS